MLRELWDLYFRVPKLTVRQKWQLVMLLWYMADAHQKYACYDYSESDVLLPRVETLSEDDIRGDRFKYGRNSIPHPVDPEDVGIFESLDGEIDDPEISEETTAKIAELVAACKELQLKVTEYFGDAQQY